MASKIDETPLYTPVQLVFKLHETRSIPTVVFFIRLSLFKSLHSFLEIDWVIRIVVPQSDEHHLLVYNIRNIIAVYIVI